METNPLAEDVWRVAVSLQTAWTTCPALLRRCAGGERLNRYEEHALHLLNLLHAGRYMLQDTRCHARVPEVVEFIAERANTTTDRNLQRGAWQVGTTL